MISEVEIPYKTQGFRIEKYRKHMRFLMCCRSWRCGHIGSEVEIHYKNNGFASKRTANLLVFIVIKTLTIYHFIYSIIYHEYRLQLHRAPQGARLSLYEDRINIRVFA